MNDQQIQTYVLNVAEEFGIRNTDTTAKVQNWDKQFMQDLLQRKISRMRGGESQPNQASTQNAYVESQIASIDEVCSTIQNRK